MSKEKTKHENKVATVATWLKALITLVFFVAPLLNNYGCYKVATGCYKIKKTTKKAHNMQNDSLIHVCSM